MVEKPRYSFEYPSDWKPQVVNKVQKVRSAKGDSVESVCTAAAPMSAVKVKGASAIQGTQGIDCIIQNPKSKGQRVFVITLARAGEELVFRLTDVDSTFASFTGADYDLLDAVSSGEIISDKRMVGDQQFYDYLIAGDVATFRSTVTINAGKVYAMFIRTPSRSYPAFEKEADAMLYSFRTI